MMKWLSISLLLPGLSTLALSQGDEPSETDFLYFDPRENDPVMEFVPAMGSAPSRGDFRASPKPKVVEFYNPYCGACQSYKPTFIRLASDLKREAAGDLEIYAVSCQVHNDLCNSYNIEDIPTVGLFPKGQSSARSMKRLEGKEKHPSFILPYLFPTEQDDFKDNRVLAEGKPRLAPDDPRYPRNPRTLAPGHIPAHMRQGNFARPVEGPGALMKKQNFSDMDRFQGALKEQFDNQKSIFRRQKPLGEEAEKVKVEKIDKDGATEAMKANTPGTKEFEQRTKNMEKIQEAFLKKKGLRTTAPGPTTRSAGATNNLPPNSKPVLPYKKDANLIKMPRYPQEVAAKVPIIKRFVSLSHEEELILDASLSFLHSLKTGVFSDSDPLNKHKQRALQNWLDLLRVSLPPEWGLHETIMDLDNNMGFISQNNNNLLKVLAKHQLKRTKWSNSCTSGSAGAFGGFNCGFWKLLHIISVGVAEHQGGMNLIESNLVSKEAKVFSPADAAEVMKEFIKYFFACTECRNHFVAQYDDCTNRRCVRLTDDVEFASFADWQELAKWLWEVHNDVNVRLVHERFARTGKEVTATDEIGALYPNLKTCVSCFRADGGFDEDGVFLFLEKEYWPGASSHDPRADRLLYFYNTEYVGFAKAWALLFVGVGIIYMCTRNRSVFQKQKRRAD